MIKSISHSNVINNHWNWASKINFKDFENFHIEVTKHGFTHVDAPSHMIKNGKSLSDCKPNLLCGWAKLIDVSECLGDKPITSDFLESKAIDINHLNNEGQLEALVKARQLLERKGKDPDKLCTLRHQKIESYQPYKRGLRLWDGKELKALEKVSPLVEGLINPARAAWLIHPREIHEDLKKAINL